MKAVSKRKAPRKPTPKKRNAASKDDFDAMKELIRVQKTTKSGKRKVTPTLEDVEVMKVLLKAKEKPPRKARKKTPKKARIKLPQTTKRNTEKGLGRSKQRADGKVSGRSKERVNGKLTGGKAPRKKRTTPPKKTPVDDIVSVEEFEKVKLKLKEHKMILKQLVKEVAEINQK